MAKRFSSFISKNNSSSVKVSKKKAFYEENHMLEKLEFALAISESKGDQDQSDIIRSKILRIGEDLREPGT
tara:strand:+ start:1050 stop:1262 length:213 start_codon:yes stop_codon:yes gene_type:complete